MDTQKFFLLTSIPPDVIKGNYNLWLVGLSYIVAVFASYVALDMAGRLRDDSETASHKKLWLFGGAFAMGAGIWSMHFIGMLAYIMPMPMIFDYYHTALSMVFAIAASLIALSLLKNKNFRRIHLICGGIILGIAIASMHYMGMEAMRFHINFSYIPGFFALSIIIALFASEAALWLALQSNKGSLKQQLFSKSISALIMGVAICGMHYTGMAATVFTSMPNVHEMSAYNPVSLAISIAVVTLIIIGLALIVSTYKRLMLSALQEKNDALAKAHQELSLLNHTLENRVEERTVELQILYNDLEEKSIKLEEALTMAESANKLKSEFLANVSHELRTPLNAIIGYSEILLEDANEAKLEEYSSNSKKVLDSSLHLLNLINDVLDLSKVEAGKMDMFLEEVNINDFVNSLQDIITPLMKQNNNTFILDISSQVNIIHTDSVRLRQALLNLLSNASKFTKNGMITLKIEPLMQNNQTWVKFSVCDTGIGISSEKTAKLFQAFTQIDGSTTRKFGGTGLGLYLSKRFVEMLGGWITFTSEEGKGSEFIMTLPQKSIARIEKEKIRTIDHAEIITSSKFKGKTVLIIDDLPDTHREIQEILEKSGFKILHAFNGEEGLSMAKRYKPDIITLDVITPVMDGWTVLSALKSDEALSSIPVILITLVSEKEVGFSLSPVEYFHKPIDIKRVIEKIKQLALSEKQPILIVDDNRDARQIMTRAAQKGGFNTIEATNGREAMEQLHHTIPSVILLDLMMPEMDGFAVIQEMQKSKIWRKIPVIILTAKDLTREERIMLAGYSASILEKGQDDPQELLTTLCEQSKITLPSSNLAPEK